jgi:large subunit ribosomal protein L30
MSSKSNQLLSGGDQPGVSLSRQGRGTPSTGNGRLRITYSTSSIGLKQDQKDTVLRLGLRRLGQTVEQPNSPAVRGMIHKVRHLLTVEEVKE